MFGASVRCGFAFFSVAQGMHEDTFTHVAFEIKGFTFVMLALASHRGFTQSASIARKPLIGVRRQGHVAMILTTFFGAARSRKAARLLARRLSAEA